MSTPDVVKRLEDRAVAAEQLIEVLKKQIEEIKRSGHKVETSGEEIARLQKENVQLKADIGQWVAKLEKAEKSNGGKQIDVDASALHPFLAGQGGAPPASSPAATTEKKEAAAKKVDKKKDAKPEGKKAEVKAEAKAVAKPEAKAEAKAEGKAKQKKGAEPAAKAEAADDAVHVGRLDMRVGLIRSAKKHPDADALYVEEVDVGEEKPRTVISGLVKFVPLEEMQNRKAILLCNLKATKMRGILSEAMVMCASTPEKVEILLPPEDSKPGDVVTVAGYDHRPDDVLNPKKKIFETCAPDLTVNGDRVATYKGVPWTVNGKHCLAPSLVNVNIK